MKQSLLIAIAICFAIAGRSQIVNIPDANFKAYLVGNSAINTNGDGEIQLSEAAAFTGAISVGSLSIFDLAGIEAFTALTNLYCQDNFLTNISISACTMLTRLDCYNNFLTTLDISSNTSLVILLCDRNSLTNLDVSNNTSLISLGCNQNSLTSLNLPNSSTLKTLYCQSNSLTNLDVSGCPGIQTLWCFFNSLTNLNVSNCIILKDLNCNSNLLTNLDIRNGNNTFMNFYGIANPQLYCILVDDSTWANNNWSSDKDSWAWFSNNCTVGIEEYRQDNTTEVTIYDLYGRKVNRINKFQVYVVRTKSNGKYSTKKVVLIQ